MGLYATVESLVRKDGEVKKALKTMIKRANQAKSLYAEGKIPEETYKPASDFGDDLLDQFKLEVNSHGLENKVNGSIIASKHWSAAEIMCFLSSQYPDRVYFATKTELFRLSLGPIQVYTPWLGKAMQAVGMCEINRSNPSQATSSLDNAAGMITEYNKNTDYPASLLVFPEGTRSPGDSLEGFRKKGAFYASIKSGLPIQPIAVRVSENIADPRYIGGYVLIKGGWVDYHVMPAIHPPSDTAGLRVEEVKEIAHNLLQQTKALVAQGQEILRQYRS
ncbi:1-acyl-sn-glycerol-3-phosphate acyltransferase [Candidatus Woesearchaeota archaeon]|nr:1-acyl-sn-glycerol-3-phosphate acyltransferase [Candidatus Woesearchaeota archaeon]